MQLRVRRPHRSITQLPPNVDLPMFTLLVGPNGAGKSQLLDGIARGDIECIDDAGAPLKIDEIRSFNWQNFLPRNEKEIPADKLEQSRLQLWQSVSSIKNAITKELLLAKKQNPQATDLINDANVLPLYQLADIREDLSNKEDAEEVHDWLQKKITELTSKHLNSLSRRRTDLFKLLSEITKDLEVPIHLLTYDSFLDWLPVGWTPSDPFTASLTTAFAEYRGAELTNRKNRIRAGQDSNIAHLSPELFVEKYGPPPWEILNEILATSRLSFQVSEPSSGSQNEVKFELTHKLASVPLKITDLSSGEQILLGIARCLFYMNLGNVRLHPPKLLLLDEVDAPLHPAMTKQLIDVLSEVVVRQHGIQVILATHSPTTVALSPEESLFSMQPTSPRLSKTSKDIVLASLTSGLPMLSVKYENRRQVFVESEYDEKIYEPIFRKLRHLCNPEVSLHFIASGRGGAGNCDQVKNIVHSLQKTGNASVRGIVDWDKKYNGTEYVRPFGIDKRYAIENYLFDPLLVAVFLFRERWVNRRDVHLAENQNHADFPQLKQETLQAVADWFVAVVEKKCTDETIDQTLISCDYLNECSISLPNWYLLMKGHDLEEQIKEAFPELKRFKKEGDLKLSIVQKVIDDLPSLLSKDFVALFKELQR